MLPTEGNQRKGNTRNSSSASSPKYVTDLGPYDILLGRGAPIVNYEGNVRFRNLINTRKVEYNGTSRHQIKDAIARQIVVEIGQRGGRFLKRIESREECRRLEIPDGIEAWTIVGNNIIMEKVKQALRDKEPVGATSIPQTYYHDFNLQQEELPNAIDNSRQNQSLAALIATHDLLRQQGIAPPLLTSSSLPYSTAYQQNQSNIVHAAAAAAAAVVASTGTTTVPISLVPSISDNDLASRMQQQQQQQLYPTLPLPPPPHQFYLNGTNSNLLSTQQNVQQQHQDRLSNLNVTSHIISQQQQQNIMALPTDTTNIGDQYQLLLQQSIPNYQQSNLLSTSLPTNTLQLVAQQQQQQQQPLVAQYNRLLQGHTPNIATALLPSSNVTSSLLSQQQLLQQQYQPADQSTTCNIISSGSNNSLVQQQLDTTLLALYRQNEQLLSNIIQNNPSIVGLPSFQNIINSSRSQATTTMGNTPQLQLVDASFHSLGLLGRNVSETVARANFPKGEHRSTERNQLTVAFESNVEDSDTDRKRKARSENSESSSSSTNESSGRSYDVESGRSIEKHDNLNQKKKK